MCIFIDKTFTKCGLLLEPNQTGCEFGLWHAADPYQSILRATSVYVESSIWDSSCSMPEQKTEPARLAQIWWGATSVLTIPSSEYLVQLYFNNWSAYSTTSIQLQTSGRVHVYTHTEESRSVNLHISHFVGGSNDLYRYCHLFGVKTQWSIWWFIRIISFSSNLD